MSEHKDTGFRCLVAHYDGPGGRVGPGCIRCTCGQYVRPAQWKEHCKAATPAPTQEGA